MKISGCSLPLEFLLLVPILKLCTVTAVSTQHNLQKRFTKKDICNVSLETLRIVQICPTNYNMLQARAQSKRCQKYPPCQDEPLVYHCTRYTDKLVEVCAPKGLITGGCCAQFDKGIGRVVEDYSKPCSECNFHYHSNESSMYAACVTPLAKTIFLTSEEFNKKRVSRVVPETPSDSPCQTHVQPRVKRDAGCREVFSKTFSTAEMFSPESAENKSQSTNENRGYVYIMIIAPAGVVLILIGVTSYLVYTRRRRNNNMQSRNSPHSEVNNKLMDGNEEIGTRDFKSAFFNKDKL